MIGETIVVRPPGGIVVRTPIPIAARLRVEIVAIKANAAATKAREAETNADSNPATQPPPQLLRVAAMSAAPAGPTIPTGQRTGAMTAARGRTLLPLRTVDLRSVRDIRHLVGDSRDS